MTDETPTPDQGAKRPKGQPPKGTAKTAWEDQGSLVERLRSRGSNRSRAEDEAEADAIAHTEAQLVHEREVAGAGRTTYGGPAEHGPVDHGDHEPLLPALEPVHHVPTPEEVTRAEKRAERLASAMFLLSSACVVGFMASYLWINVHQHPTALNVALGGTLGGALFFIGAAAIVWAKGIMPHEPAVQARYPDRSSAPDKAALAADWLVGVEESGATRRKMLLGTMGVSMGTLALPAVFILRDLGPSPFSAKGGKNLLDVTAWAKDLRLVDIVTQLPVNIADVGVGSLTTVVPEGHANASADSSVMVVRLNPEDLNLPAFKADEVLQGIIAYSKICTHAGCPVSLYEQQRHHFLCPCHQSTFDAADRGKVLFGPAARALPILPIYQDAQGYLHAVDTFREPVGPSFWERG
ncbi:MAG: ubiquinol-cytochrome c reductase iron-sulfur subunit [Frankiales bacterium]|jgi:ubiquinol-cytochrome c reductase iron-sulfur subunit|nr:ubiquinol-cytochrome c reductase iron-sulfur subunit [Frankiales bacterium]